MCLNCDTGKVSSIGASVCSGCPSGYECIDGSQTPCDEGYYSNNEESCKICDEGFMCLGASDHRACPPGTSQPNKGQP
ncbi:hypothetical protein TrRE_jg2541, partial [Triparma retinervis]